MDFKMDLHAHTVASGHAYGTVTEMVKAASERGLELFALTEHGPMLPGSCSEIYFYNTKIIPRHMFGVELMFGSEMNILDNEGNLDLDEDAIEQCLDIRLAGIHDFSASRNNIVENTQAFVKTIENPRIDIITHPDDSRIPVDYETIVDAAKENHTLLEVNNSSLDHHTSRVGAHENLTKMLGLCKEKNVPIICNTDSHFTHTVGNFNHVEPLLTELDFPEELVVNRSVDALKQEILAHRQIHPIGDD